MANADFVAAGSLTGSFEVDPGTVAAVVEVVDSGI